MAITWDAATVTAVTLSGGGLVATNTGTTSADQGARVATANGKTSGKWYFEITWTAVTSGIGSNLGIGVGTTASTYTGMGNGGTTGITHYLAGSYYSNGSVVSTGTGGWSVGQVAGIAYDLDNRRFWARQSPSGVWNGSGTNNPATNVGGYVIPAGTMVPFVTFGGSTGAANNVFSANFAGPFVGATPSGFIAVDPVTDARVTQVAAEHWLTTNPAAQITQVVAEHWASVASGNLQAVVTQVLLEHWASVAVVVPAAGGPMVTMIH